MMLSLQRIFKSGWEKFVRDRSSTGAAFVVMVVALFVVSSLYVFNGLSSFVVAELQERVDVSAYFQEEATEEEVFLVRQKLLGMEEVREVAYVSKEQAFEMFLETHQDDEALLEPLEAIGQNPFVASLKIKARNPEDLQAIAAFLEGEDFASVVENVDFHNRMPVIEQISLLAGAIRAGAVAVIGVLSFIAVLVAFNTIRLTIYNAREEIEVQRLVGASNWFIRGPFLVQGVLVGAISSVAALAILFFLTLFAGSSVESFTSFSASAFFGAHAFVLFVLNLAVGVGLGAISSAIAIRKYLRV